eukprot:Hpha_TRINITY_DN9458_c1_g1::TRINITY_DN9458_c1_g1_i1::g.139173::m.139173
MSIVVEEREGRGQCLVARRRIEAGEVILEERALSTVLLAEDSDCPLWSRLRTLSEGRTAVSTLRESFSLCHWMKHWCALRSVDGPSLPALLRKWAGDGTPPALLRKVPLRLQSDGMLQKVHTGYPALVRVWDLNSFAIELPGILYCRALFDTGSRLNHDCNPSAETFVHMEPPGSTRPGEIERESGAMLKVVALRTLEPGTEITFSYLDDESLAGDVERRRRRLCGQWRFDCTCSRCAAELAVLPPRAVDAAEEAALLQQWRELQGEE